MPWPERSIDGSLSPGTLASIHGRELLIQHLGHWPTFHDFEIISIALERAPWLTTATSDLRVTFYVYDLHEAPEASERKQAFAEMLFERIDDLRIDGFNHQNPIMGLSIISRGSEDSQPPFMVEWGGTCLHHEVSFLLRRFRTTSCDCLSIPLTSHWTGDAIIKPCRRMKRCIVTSPRALRRPMPCSLVGEAKDADGKTPLNYALNQRKY